MRDNKVIVFLSQGLLIVVVVEWWLGWSMLVWVSRVVIVEWWLDWTVQGLVRYLSLCRFKATPCGLSVWARLGSLPTWWSQGS